MNVFDSVLPTTTHFGIGLGFRFVAVRIAVAFAGDLDHFGMTQKAIQDGGRARDVADQLSPILDNAPRLSDPSMFSDGAEGRQLIDNGVPFSSTATRGGNVVYSWFGGQPQLVANDGITLDFGTEGRSI